MKTPAPPPERPVDLSSLVRTQPDRLATIFENVPTAADEYIPWDKLRYRMPPEGLSHEEWWFATRTGRASLLRKLPLTAVDGTNFAYALPDEVLRLNDEVTRRASGQIAAPEPVTNPATRDRYVISSLIEEAITSSQLEGAVTSRRDAKHMITYGTKPKNRSEQMILNNYNAMLFISENKDGEFTPAAVCELHRIVTEKTLDNPDAAGRLQSNPDPADRVKIYDEEDNVLHIPPSVEELPQRLKMLCEFANAQLDAEPYVPPVIRALTVHFMAGYDHYFEDGNGRTARALFYWSMLKQGYWLTEYLTISKILKAAPAQYARSFLLTEQDGGDLTYFVIYHLGVIKRALDELNSYLERKVKELRHTRTVLSSVPGDFNHRQLSLLESAVRNPANEYTVHSHTKSHGVVEQTARTDLYDLEGRGLLKRYKVGKQFVFRAVPDLSARIEQQSWAK